MRFEECIGKGLIKKDAGITERVENSLKIARKFLKSARKDFYRSIHCLVPTLFGWSIVDDKEIKNTSTLKIAFCQVINYGIEEQSKFNRSETESF